MYVPISFSIIGFSIRFAELCYTNMDNIKYYISVTLISAFCLFFFGAYIGNLGGADCLIGTLCTFYMGTQGIIALMIAFILAIPYTIWMKIKSKEKEYPFVPFILVGVSLVLIKSIILKETVLF